MLAYYTEQEQVAFISESLNHCVEYNDNNVGKQVFNQNESFFEEDNKCNVTIQQPFCRINRH